MVRQKKDSTFYDTISFVAIDASDLASLLSKYNSEIISAENAGFIFEDINDIQDNLPLMAGYPEIKSRLFNVEFTKFHEVRISAHSEDGLNNSAQSLLLELREYRSISRCISYYSGILSFTFLSVSFLIASLKNHEAINYDTWQDIIINNQISLILFSFFLISISVSRIYSRIPPVIYRKRDNFWDRNRDTIIVGFITAIIGIIIGTVSTVLFDLLT